MHQRIHYLTGYPETHQPPDFPEILCGEPDPHDWNTDPVAVTCPDCWLLMGYLLEAPPGTDAREAHRKVVEGNADLYRRAELDSELSAMGAVTIQVKDLGKALEAEFLGRCCWQYAGNDPSGFYAPRLDRDLAAHAAHLARVALGEVSS